MTEEKKKMSQLQKQMLIILICIVSFAVLAGLYFLVLEPIIIKLTEPEVFTVETLDDGTERSVLKSNKHNDIILTLLPGEEVSTFGTNHRIMITPKVERADIKNVQVKNKDDSYKLIHHLGANSYYVDGAELVPIDQEIIASFFTNVGYLLSMTRVAAEDIEDGNEILSDLEAFGLNPENPEIYFIVTDTDDEWYKIIIGDKIPTTGGYYVMYEDKDGLRPAIYILDTMMEETILSKKYSLMLPLIAIPIKQNETLYIDNFKFYKGRDLMVEIYNAPIPEGSEALVNWQMKYPAPYMVSDRYSSLTSAFLYFTGDRVVYAFSEDDIIAFNTENGELSDEAVEKFQEFGFDEYTAQISFDFMDRDYYFIFSKPDENGNYYVLSMDFYSIVQISPDKLKLEGDLQLFIEWDVLKFVNKSIFDININDVESIMIKTPGKKDAFFTIERPDETKRDLIVKGNGVDIQVDGMFRDLYYSILSIELEDYADNTNIYEDKDPMLEMIIMTRDGVERYYRFYFVEEQSRRCFYSINGFGDFYVLRDKVLKLANDTEKILQNLPIDREARE